MVKLLEALVLSRCRAREVRFVKNLNLYGTNLDDISLIGEEMAKVEVVSLSVNQISSLDAFKPCANLRELYLRKNAIKDLPAALECLSGLQNLRILWLSENPCADDPQYRLKVVHALPQLVKLDDADITTRERAEAEEASAAWAVAKEKEKEVEVVREEEEEEEKEIRKKKKKKQKRKSKGSREDLRQAPPQAAAAAAEEEEDKEDDSLDMENNHDKAGSGGGSGVRVSTEQNILCAVIALLDELSAPHLRWLRDDIDKRLAD